MPLYPRKPASRRRRVPPVKGGIIGIHPSPAMAAEIERRAASLQISKSKYCRLALEDWMDKGGKLALQEN